MTDISSLKPIESGFKFVDIDHLIVISNILSQSPHNEVLIYDCNYFEIEEYSDHFKVAIIKLMNKVEEIKVIVLLVSQQACALLA
jgi:hypothetical protein